MSRVLPADPPQSKPDGSEGYHEAETDKLARDVIQGWKNWETVKLTGDPDRIHAATVELAKAIHKRSYMMGWRASEEAHQDDPGPF